MQIGEAKVRPKTVKCIHKYEDLMDDALTHGIDSDILDVKRMGPFKEIKNTLKKCEILIEDIENDMILGEAKTRRTTAKLLHKCEKLIMIIYRGIFRN